MKFFKTIFIALTASLFTFTLPAADLRRLEVECKKIYRALNLNGYARLDLRLTPEGEFIFIEANPNPMLARDEDFAMSAKKAGIDYPKLIEKIITLAA